MTQEERLKSQQIANAVSALYVLNSNPYDAAIADYLNRNPSAGSGSTTYSSTSTPNSNWDDVDSAGIGRQFNIGDFVQKTTNGALYRCYDNTTANAIWRIIQQETI